jgi:hypothetical protein
MRALRLTLVSAFILFAAIPLAARAADKPPAWTAKLAADGHHVELAYHGTTWVSGLRVEATSGGKKLRSDAPEAKLALSPEAKPGETVIKVEGPISYEIVLRSMDSSLEISLRGLAAKADTIAFVMTGLSAGPEPLQARLDEVEDDVQQMVSGRAASSLNNSLYDRFRDQALKVLARETRFSATREGFSVATAGPLGKAPICSFQVIDQVYAKRLPFYSPLDKKKWPHAPAGWCSWYYYFSHVKEEDIVRNAQAIARDYKPFGLEYCLIDAGWQVAGDGENGAPIGGNWTDANEKFPHGMKWIADQIRASGLKPGLWLAVFGNADEKFYSAHKNWFVHEENGNAKLGTWFGTYVADFSHPDVKKFLYDVYRRHTLDWGYDYFKLDGENDTRDIWGQNRVRGYDPTLDANVAYRQTLSLIRQAMSSKPDVFFSACGPVYPTESMGVAQAARLGGDVVGDKEPPSFRGVRTALEAMRRGYYTHNIAWYADPDVLVVRPPLTADEARTWTSILGLSGQLLMLSDDMATLPDDRREMLRKIIPVADITPMELYPAATDRHIWVLHVARPFGSWAVTGLFNWDSDGREIPAGEQSEIFNILGNNDRLLGIQREWGEQLAIASDAEKALAENRRYESLPNKPAGLRLLPVPAYLAPPPPRHFAVRFGKVGLDRERDYLLFDFWNQKFLGKVRGEYTVDLAGHVCQVLSMRPAEDRPQLVGTDRHITMGAAELKDEKWDAARKQLRIKVALVENYPTTLSVYPAGRSFKEARATGATVEGVAEGEIVRAKLTSAKSGDVEVTLQFE